MTEREIRRIHAACVVRSWDDSTDDDSRIVLEQATDVIRHLRGMVHEMSRRLARQALHLERAELALQRGGGE